MPIKYCPRPRTVLLCDHGAGGFQPPEMVKRRPVIVIVARPPHRDNLATVVPLSATPPLRPVGYQCRLTLDTPLPAPFDAPEVWVKADMLATVSLARLDFFREARDAAGRRRHPANLRVSEAQFAEVMACVGRALDLR